MPLSLLGNILHYQDFNLKVFLLFILFCFCVHLVWGTLLLCFVWVVFINMIFTFNKLQISFLERSSKLEILNTVAVM